MTRNAWICAHKTKGASDCTNRIFLKAGEDRIPECMEHGRTMTKQNNKPYHPKP